MTGTRRYVDLPYGQLHVQLAGPDDGEPVVLLHQTPRSVDEYRDVVPALARVGLRVVAVDTPGYGASSPVPEPSIEAWSSAIADGLARLAVADAVVVGHHTGGVVAVELAARAPGLVRGLVLSSTPLVDEAFRNRPDHGVDDVEPAADGSHLGALWQGRASFYPSGRPDLLERFVRDALGSGMHLASIGHALVRRYRMEDRIYSLPQPILLVGAPEDPFGYPNHLRMREALAAASAVEIAGGMVPLPDQFPERFAEVVTAFALRQPQRADRAGDVAR